MSGNFSNFFHKVFLFLMWADNDLNNGYKILPTKPEATYPLSEIVPGCRL